MWRKKTPIVFVQEEELEEGKEAVRKSELEKGKIKARECEEERELTTVVLWGRPASAFILEKIK